MTLDLTHAPEESKTLSNNVGNEHNSSIPASPNLNATVKEIETTSISSGSATDTTSSLISESEGEQEVPSVLDLLRRFLFYSAKARVRAEDALRHPWFLERMDGKSVSTSTSLSHGPSKADMASDSSEAAAVNATEPQRELTVIPSSRSNGSLNNEAVFLEGDKEQAEDQALPLLLLPPGYALERGPPSLKSISADSWCGFSLESLLEDIMGNAAGGT